MTTLAQRLRAVEARLAEIEGGDGETLYRLQRETVRTRLDVGKIANHLGLTATTDAEV
jgi:hypothetical protein